MAQYFPKTCDRSGENTKIELDISNYATKADLKKGKGVDAFNLATKLHLASWKCKVYKTDIDKLKTVFADLSKLSNLIDK